MASGQTANFELNQWEAEDSVLREEFNRDNQKIEGALTGLTAEMPHMVVGSYVGSGSYGSANPNTLTFPFAPKLVVISVNKPKESEQGTVFIAGQTACSGIGSVSSGTSCLTLKVSWPRNGVSWYTGEGNSYDQLNANGYTYFYFALG